MPYVAIPEEYRVATSKCTLVYAFEKKRLEKEEVGEG